MNRENLDNANEINAKIKELEKERSYWAYAARITSINIYNNGSCNTSLLPTVNFLPFDVVKTLVLASLDKAITELTEKINQLS